MKSESKYNGWVLHIASDTTIFRDTFAHYVNDLSHNDRCFAAIQLQPDREHFCSIEWRTSGELHRDTGPAYIYLGGDKNLYGAYYHKNVCTGRRLISGVRAK